MKRRKGTCHCSLDKIMAALRREQRVKQANRKVKCAKCGKQFRRQTK